MECKVSCGGKAFHRMFVWVAGSALCCLLFNRRGSPAGFMRRMNPRHPV